MGINSSSLCTVAKDMFFASTPFIPESFFCAMSVDGGKGDSDAMNKAAQAWGEVSKQLREFHDELAGVVHSVPDSEWKAADREAYEQQANKYLEQVTTSATAAETASGLLHAVEGALDAYAIFALVEATIVVANAAAIAVADCTVVGAPEAETEGLAAGGEAYEALEGAAKILLGVLSGVAAIMEAGVLVDTGVQTGQGDNASLADFGHATVTGLTTDKNMLPNEAFDYAKGKLLGAAHGSAFPTEGESGGSSDSGSDGSSGSKSEGPGESGGDAPKDGSDNSEKKDGSDKKGSPIQPVGNDPIPKQIRSLFPEAPAS